MTFPELIKRYIQHLEGRPGHARTVRVARPWISTLTETPTRRDLMDRMQACCPDGHFTAGAVKANKELALIRAACNWGLYQGTMADGEEWDGANPTLGIKKFKTAKRTRIGRYDELRRVLQFFDGAQHTTELRDRALFGIMLFAGCRPSEARGALLSSITAYGSMGCWRKTKTKTGQGQELPLPSQAMDWLKAWLAVREKWMAMCGVRSSPFIFPGHMPDKPLSEDGARVRWSMLRKELGLTGLWTYDLRRTLASYLGNELKYDDKTIQAVLNHYDGRAISHYYHVSFDALTSVVQRYADWLYSLKAAPQAAPAPVPMPVLSYDFPNRDNRVAVMDYPG